MATPISLGFVRRVAFLILAFLIGAAAARAPLEAQAHTNCVSCPTLSITPDGGTDSKLQNGTYTLKFVARNTGSAVGNWSFHCSATGGASCSAGDVEPASLPDMDPGEVDTLVATYTLGVTSGAVTVTATGSTTETGSYNISVIGVAPALSLVVPTLTGGSRALVHNRQPVLRALITQVSGSPIDTTTISLSWKGTARPAARFNRGLIEWEVDSASRLAVGDSGLISITACAAGSQCTTANRYAVLANDSTPVIGLTGMPLEALASGFSSPFGPGFGLSGSEVQTGVSSVPYFSRDAAQSAGLIYSTRQSYPRAIVPVNIELPWPSGTPTSVKVVLIDGASRVDSGLVSSPTCTTWSTKLCRMVLQLADSTTTVASPTRQWLKVEATVVSGGTAKSSVDSVEVALVDRRTTRYGTGWWPSAEIELVGSGSDRLLVGADGGATLFRGNGDSIYSAPPSNFSILTKVGSGWELKSRGSVAKVVFDSLGRLSKGIGVSSDTTRLVYNGTTDELDSIIDPTHHGIAFGYTASKLSSIASLSGGAQRVGHIHIDANNQVTATSMSAKDSTNYQYKSFAGTGTRLMTTRIGLLKDTTTVMYDSTSMLRPLQVRLPQVQDESNANVNPVIAYTAYERQGFHTLRPLDSLYVELKDPRNNWTRVLPNRWGQVLRSWDAVGAVSRAFYDGDGFLQWNEGRVADSSRTYFTYDGLHRLVNKYFYQSSTQVLRLDSLVYDGSHRIIKRIDARGVTIDTIGYDGSGRIVYEKDAAGQIARTHYSSLGLIDSSLVSGNSTYRTFGYDGTWTNVQRVVDESGLPASSRVFDTYGRVTRDSSERQIQQPQDTSSRWAYSRTLTYYSAANQVDSAHTQQSSILNCKTCAFSFLTDSSHSAWKRYTYDVAGRDSLFDHNWGIKSRVDYDRLGRVRASRPWTDSTGVVDSTFYDVAGNVKKTIDRMGRVITVDYDSRNRDTLAVIPGVGTRRKLYAGPLDQLTREWLSTSYDSIGNVNGELRFGFDQRGRLKADTSYTGTTARPRTHTYDRYERDSLAVDALGTWVTKYDAVRGVVDTIVAPWGDTVSYSYDSRWRAIGPTLSSGPQVAKVGVVPAWTQTGELDTLVEKVGATTFGRYARQFTLDDDANALVPSWSDLFGTWQDSITYDAWRRVTVHAMFLGAGGTRIASDSLWFDPAQNVRTSATVGTNEIYDRNTNRLTSQVIAGVTWALKYDRAGNLILRVAAADSTRYLYDGSNRLRSVWHRSLGHVDSLVARYDYDVAGRRIAKKVYNAGTGGTLGFTRFVYRRSNVEYETNDAGAVGQQYLWGIGGRILLAIRNAAGTNFFAVTDKLGSVRGLIERDSTALGLLYLAYGTYGRVVDSAGTGLGSAVVLRFRWAGQEYDPETSYYHMNARYYSAQQMRFVQEDPLGLAGGVNPYAYADGSPLERTDQSGMRSDFAQHARDGSYGLCIESLWGCAGRVGGGGGGVADEGEAEWADDLAYSSSLVDAAEAKIEARIAEERLVNAINNLHSSSVEVGPLEVIGKAGENTTGKPIYEISGTLQYGTGGDSRIVGKETALIWELGINIPEEGTVVLDVTRTYYQKSSALVRYEGTIYYNGAAYQSTFYMVRGTQWLFGVMHFEITPHA